MINTMDELIAQCKNKIKIVGSLYELALFFKNRNDSVVLEYKGVVQVDNAFIRINGRIYEKDRAFYNFLDDFGIPYKLTQNILHKEYSTVNQLISPPILTITVNDERVYTKTHSLRECSVYVSGKIANNGSIKAQYIRLARATEVEGIEYELVGAAYSMNEYNELEILIADNDHHQDIMIPLTNHIDTCWLYSFDMDWQKLVITDLVIQGVHTSKIIDSKPIDEISEDLVNQIKIEYDIYIEAMKGK